MQHAGNEERQYKYKQGESDEALSLFIILDLFAKIQQHDAAYNEDDADHAYEGDLLFKQEEADHSGCQGSDTGPHRIGRAERNGSQCQRQGVEC